MKEIIIKTPKEEQFYEVVEFYGKNKDMYNFKQFEENSCINIDCLSNVFYDHIAWLNDNMPNVESITFEQWKESVDKKENTFTELIQDIDLDIEILELARKLVTAGRIQDGATLSIIAGNSMKEKVNK